MTSTQSPLSTRKTRIAPSESSVQPATRYSSVPTNTARRELNDVSRGTSDTGLVSHGVTHGTTTLARNRNTAETARMVPAPPMEIHAAATRSASLTDQRVRRFLSRGFFSMVVFMVEGTNGRRHFCRRPPRLIDL